MIIRNAILRADSRHAIYFLLTSYVEAVGCGLGGELPQYAARLPLTGLADLTARYRAITARLEEATGMNDADVAAVKEAAEIFRSALLRLRWLEHRGDTTQHSLTV